MTGSRAEPLGWRLFCEVESGLSCGLFRQTLGDHLHLVSPLTNNKSEGPETLKPCSPGRPLHHPHLSRSKMWGRATPTSPCGSFQGI